MSQIDIYGKTKTEKAIELLKFFEPPEGYYLEMLEDGHIEKCRMPEE